MEGLTLDEETFASIARLPSRDVLNGQFAGVVASPLTGLVRGLGSMVSGLAVALQQIAEQGLVSGEEPTAEEAKPEPAGGPRRPRTRSGGGVRAVIPRTCRAVIPASGSDSETSEQPEASNEEE